ncbi:MAG: right-handed parallel beta-helix repeat-containing protein [Kiritimatiellaeota bacterium]|nr:right-handed parallel beta-helix repeat-containing protein [Kiritimatiellota bacterium]
MRVLRSMLLAVISGCAGFPASGICGEIHVAPDGDDRNPGTLEKPFVTLGRARDAVRALKAAGPGRDFTVQIRGGSYRLRKTVVFGLADGAPDGHTITFAARAGETPVFTAGVPITGWRKVESPPSELPDKAHGKVWWAPVPDGLDRFHTLYDGARRLRRARGNGFKPVGSSPQFRADDQHVLRFPAGAIRNGQGLADVEVVLVTAAPWTMNILPLASVDEAAGVARTSIPGTYALLKPRFGNFPASAWVENTLEALDEPGEWVLDSRARRIYLWPEKDEPGSDIVAPALTELIRVEGAIDYDGPRDTPVRGLVFRGLTFTQADRYTYEKGRVGWGLQHDWEMFDRSTAMVRLRGAEECAIEQCRFADSGAAAVRLDLHCRNNRIDGNVIERVGGVGVLLAGYGPGTKDVNTGNSVTGNHIHHIGELYWHSPAIFAWQSGSNRIANNLIHHTPYSAIAVTGRIAWDREGKGECSRTVRWNEVEAARQADPRDRQDWYERERFLHGRKNMVLRNEIHHAMEIMCDGNGVYISGAGGGNVVRENFIHDCPSEHFGEGIRCDDDQYETVIDRNILWRLGGMATFVCLKGKNYVTGNILAEPLAPPKRGMFSIEAQRYPMEGAKIERNIFYATRRGDKIFEGEKYLPRCEVARNLYFNTADPEWGSRYLTSGRKQDPEQKSLVADPLFVDPASGDFRLKPGSPALTLGFEPINRSVIGLIERPRTEAGAK